MLIIVYILPYQLCGVGLIGVGIWMIIDPNILGYISVLSAVETSGVLLKYASYVLIGAGALIFVVSFCGCVGSWQENRCLLGTVSIYTYIITVGMGEVWKENNEFILYKYNCVHRGTEVGQ